VEELRVRAILAQRHPRYVERALANVERFLEMAKPYAVRGLRVFADDMTQLWEEGESEVEGRADASREAVHIVSIHSAKGLEWPVVIPINLVTNTRSANGVLHRNSDNTLHCSLGSTNPPEYEVVKDAEDRELADERIRLLYVACTRARDLLVFPHYLGKLGRSWHTQVDLQLQLLPEFPIVDLGQEHHKPISVTPNEQTTEVFCQETLTLEEQTRKIRWVQPSRADLDEISALMPEDEELAESSPEIRGSAVRGRVLHKMMEEILLGEIQDDDTSVQIRATELLQQLEQSDHPDPAEGPSSHEIAATISRTLRLPVVVRHRPTLQPEVPVYQLRTAEEAKIIAVAGMVDAVTRSTNGPPEVVIDWKSDVAPDPETRQHHMSQVREYLDCTKAMTGFVVYMTTGEVQQVIADSPTRNTSVI